MEKNYGQEDGYHVFPSESFCLTVPKKFVGHPSVFQKIFGMKKIMDKRTGITFFRRKFFVSQCRKNSWGTFSVSKNLGYRKILCISRFSVENFQSHSAKKLHGGTILCFRNFSVRKKLWIRGREVIMNIR